MKKNTNASDVILITDEWENYSSKLDPNLFNEFMMIYTNLTKESETHLDIDKFEDRLTKIGIYNNPKVGRLFNQLYYVNTNNPEAPQIVIITGFLDVTDFLNNKFVQNNDEIQFLWSVISLFINCGGIVRIRGVDYFPGEDDAMCAFIKKEFNIK